MPPYQPYAALQFGAASYVGAAPVSEKWFHDLNSQNKFSRHKQNKIVKCAHKLFSFCEWQNNSIKDIQVTPAILQHCSQARIQGVGAGARAHPWGGVLPLKMHYSTAFKHGRPPLGEILYPPVVRTVFLRSLSPQAEHRVCLRQRLCR